MSVISYSELTHKDFPDHRTIGYRQDYLFFALAVLLELQASCLMYLLNVFVCEEITLFVTTKLKSKIIFSRARLPNDSGHSHGHEKGISSYQPQVLGISQLCHVEVFVVQINTKTCIDR